MAVERGRFLAQIIAGGTDLLVDLKTGRVVADHVVSLHGIDGLRGLEMDGGALRIGAQEFLAVVEHDAATAFKLLKVVTGYLTAPVPPEPPAPK